MKKILCIFVFAVLLLTSLGVWARPVSVDQARQVAESFLRGVGCRNASSLVDRSAELPFHQFYLFTAEQGGFVLVSADDCVLPILGYSTTNNFDVKGMPEHVADWLGGYEEQIAYFVRQDASLRSSGLQCGDDSGNIVMRQWELLLAGQNLEQTSSNSVSPLLSTTWNQSPYYNDLCPVDYDNYTGHAYAGCTAIATAQVMKYWNHPSQGYGSMTYYHDTYGNLSANFGGTTYQWSGMPNALSSSSTSSQINAVATLVYHVGVAVNMDYGPDGSGAQTISSGDPVQPSAENALKNNFKYSSSLHSIHRSDYAPEVFASILCAELDNSRPIIFTGYDVDAGHAFVLDGYDIYGNFHVNWGWGSYCDGYYAMGALNPSTGGAGGNTSGTYNINNSAIIGVEPNYSFSTTGTTSVSVTANPSSYGSATGSGNYNFGETVYLRANANAGCRFSQWSDGYRRNPRGFLAMGGNYSYTAHFEHLSGDTLGYVSANTMISSFGTGSTGSTAYWGIKIPASVLTSGHDLKKVQMYVACAGTYTTNIYVGSAFSTPVVSQTFTATTADEGTWKTVALTTPVTVTGNQDIYITFENYGVAYPAALTYDCGNDDGMLWGSSFSSIHDNWNYTFMVRGIFGSSIPAGDTLSYCDNNPYLTNIGAGGNLYWGIKVPGSWQVGHTYLSSVQLYVVSPGTYDLILAQGGTNAPSTTIPIQSVSFGTNDVNQWHSIPIATTYMLDSSQPLWVVFHNADAAYPAAACVPNDDANSSWCSTDGTAWGSLYTLSDGSLDYSWMIKCAVSNTLPVPDVSISGDTYFQTFTSKTFSAQSNRANATYAWTLQGATPSYATGATVTAYWSQAGIYDVIVAATSGGVTVRDTLQVEVYAPCLAITSFPYTMGFESTDDLSCWNFVDADGDGYGWTTTNIDEDVAFEGRNGGTAIGSNSYNNTSGALTPDNWLISPAITLSVGTTTMLSWYAKSYSESYGDEFYSVYISTTGNNPANFTTMLYSGITTGTWARHYADLSAYAGQTVYIAFRHHNCTDQWALLLDDITFDNNAPQYFTVTANANNSSYGSVSGGGAYLEGSSVTLYATASADCRFAYWNDGNADNPRTFSVTGNVNHTAYFEHLSGDTLRYDNGIQVSSLGRSSGSMSWAVRFNPTVMYGYSTLQKVQFPDVALGSYTIRIHRGGTTAPGTLATSQSVSLSGSGSMVTFDLNNPVSLNTSDPIWIVVDYSGTGYPAAYATSSGNTDGGWVSLDGSTWNDISEYGYANTWMLRGIMQATPNTYTITAVANNPSYGIVTGSGTYAQGSTVTLTATPNAGYQFTNWNDGNTNATRTITVSGNATYTAYFTATADPCSAITSFPYTMGFESTDDLSCWNFVDADGDGYGWDYNTFSNNNQSHTGSGVIGSASFINDIGALTPDNWMITPQMQLPANAQYNLSWWVGAVDADYCAENYTVYVSTTGNQPADFTTVLFNGTVESASYVRKNIDLSAYAGQNIYIAFRHHNITDMYWMLIDDITIDNNVPQYYTVTANANNSSYGSVSGGGTYLEGSSVTLYATASADCRFAYWDDGNADNPRTFAVTGNVSHTAYFEHLSGDTLRYDNGIQVNSLGTEDSMSWAVRFNPTVMYGYSTLQKVQFPDVALGSYTISIHRGGTTAPGTLVTSQSVSLSGSGSMVTFDLNNPVSLNTSDPIWIVVDYSGTGYPAACAPSSGNPDGGWVSLDGSTWNDISEYGYANTWMLRGIMQATPNTYTITAVANNPSYGIVTGSGTYAQGSTVTLTATPNAGYQFTNWNDGNTNATRTITVSGNATYTAYFAAAADTCLAITSFPYTMGFESTDDLSCWNFVDADGDGYGWTTTNTDEGVAFEGRSGGVAIGSNSYSNTSGALAPDNWMITPQIQLPANAQYNLSWYAKSYNANYGDEFYSVYISTTGNNPADFTTMLYSGTSIGIWARQYVNLSSYAGQTVYIAFRHYNCTDQWALLLDDITIDNNVPQYYTVTANANNSSYGSVSGDGTYLEGSSVTLYATASADCRFAYWNDGNADNPRTFAVTGNVNHTAYFEHLSGDTLRYDNGIQVNSLGTEDSMSWAVRFNPTVMYGYSTLQKVQFPDVALGSYTISIHRGGTTAPGTLVTSQPVSLSGSGSMVTIDLNNPVSLNTSDPIWIVVDYSGTGYPAACAPSSGNPDGGWVSLDGSTWNDISEYGYANTWMLRGIMQATPNTYTITAVANNPSYGIVTGSGTYAQGSTVTLTATPNAGYQFTNWNDGNTNATRTITVSGNATYTAYFTATADPCSAITSFPYTMGFESTDDLSCWNFVDADGDGYGWDYNTFSNNNQSHTGSGVIGSASFINDIGALTPDNWMITPQMQLPANAQFNLSWWVKAVDANYCAENYTVYVSTTGNQPADFTTVLFNGTVESASYVRKNIDLSAYAGQNIYIAFRHHNITDMYWMLIDDITIDNNVPQYCTVTANANNSSYGSVSGGGTYLEGSSVTLYATASADCRFAYWNDGNADNPRTFAVTGNVSHTAYFEHLSGDTLRYDNGIQVNSLGTEGSMSWAVRFNPTVMYGYSTLQKVQFPDVALGSYTISIHRGGTSAPGTLVTSQPVSLSGSGSMVTFDLNNPVSLNTSDPIWIVVDYSGTGYPAACAASSGNPDGGWVSLDGSTWNDISEYGYANTWVLRGIMQATPNTYTITAVANNPSYGIVTGSGTYAQGSTVTLTATPNAGYQFTNWNDGNTNATRTITVSGNATYTAYFQPIPRYDVTIACMGTGSGEVERADSPGSNICGTVDQVYEGFVASYKFLPSQGSQLSHLYVNNIDRINEVQTSSSASSSSYSLWSYTPTGSTTIYSVFDLRNFTVDVATSNPAQGSVMGSGVYPYGSNVTLTAQPATGYHFAYWTITTPTGNTTSFQNPYVGTITGDMSATAYFDSDSYQITVTANDPTRGEVTGSGEYLYLEAVTATATPYSGYYFAGWSNGTNYNPYSFPATQDLVLQALFLPESDTTTYVVNAVANDPTMGSVTGAGTYASGQQATITAQPSEGHHFVYWEISDGNLGDSYTSTQNPYIFTVEGFTEFRAIFAIDTFEITVSPNDPLRGTVSGSGQYTYMEAVTVIATPYSGYYFACWDNGSTQNPYMFQAIGNDTLVALFLPDGDATTYQITVSVNDSTMGEATGGGTYQQGETVTLSATAYEGYRFDNWSDGSTENPRTVVVTENKTYVAYFSSLTGIAEVRSVAVALYPNPTKGKIHVDADVVERIQIYDQVGRLIGVYEHTNEVDISGFASGIYTLRIQMPLGEEIKKVIKVDF